MTSVGAGTPPRTATEARTPTVRLDYPVNALVSFHYFARLNLAPLAAGGLRLIGDSGAYSAASLGTPIDVDEFASWAVAQRASLCWVASLDVIGDADATWRNYRHMRYSRGVDVVPTVHYGADPRALDRYADDGVDLVGLGGMVPHKSSPDRLLRWCVQMFRYARDTHPGMRFHGWGVTHRQLVENLPWWSVDSSGAGSAYRYGRASIYDPDTGKTVTFATDARSAHAHGTLLRRHYGIDPAMVSSSTSSNRVMHVRLGARSLQLREQRLRAKFRVTPPTYGCTTGPAQGPNVHFVDAAHSHLAHLMYAPPPGPNLHLAFASMSEPPACTRPKETP